MCRHATIRLDCRPESVTVGRHFVCDRLSGWGAVDGDPALDALGDAALVATELLANAVMAAAGPIGLSVDTGATCIYLAVREGSPETARPRAALWDGARGRGLAIVEAVSAGWGQTAFAGSKEVWAQIGLAPGSALGEGCGG